MNYQLKESIEATPENKTRLIVKETASFAGNMADIVPQGKINWTWIIANWSTLMLIVRLVIDFIKKLKEIANGK
jgi:hypothetical protein